jgi:hypothetical protein
MDIILLSQIACEATTTPALSEGKHSPLALTMSLLSSGKQSPSNFLMLPPEKKRMNVNLQAIRARFSNNNFVLHSHLTSFAHGVYPVASRLFNHSCQPNAAIKYNLSGLNRPIMEVIALRDISSNEEVTQLPFRHSGH